MSKNLSFALLLLMGLVAPAGATVVTFSGLPGPHSAPVTTYTESGYTVTNLANFLLSRSWGHPIPSIYLLGVANGASGEGSFLLTSVGGGAFFLNSFEISPDSILSYTVTGTLAGAPVFTFGDTAVGFSWKTITPGSPAAPVDAVMFTFFNPDASANVDNIEVSSAVPEPITLLLFVGGLAGLFRRRTSRGL